MHAVMSHGEWFMFRTTYAQRSTGKLNPEVWQPEQKGSAETGIIICNYHSPPVKTALDGL